MVLCKFVKTISVTIWFYLYMRRYRLKRVRIVIIPSAMSEITIQTRIPLPS